MFGSPVFRFEFQEAKSDPLFLIKAQLFPCYANNWIPCLARLAEGKEREED
jgi:hypothetical protein